MQFFSSDKGLQEIFFRNHPHPPSRVKWSAPKEFSNNFDRKIRTFWEYFIFLCQTIQKYILVFAVNEVSELERTVNSLCYRIHYRFIILQTRLNKLIYANCYLKHVAKKKFKNHMFPYMIKPRKKSFLCRLENLWM